MRSSESVPTMAWTRYEVPLFSPPLQSLKSASLSFFVSFRREHAMYCAHRVHRDRAKTQGKPASMKARTVQQGRCGVGPNVYLWTLLPLVWMITASRRRSR